MTNILFLGIGADQLPAIEIANKMGLGIIGFDGDPNAVGKDNVNHFICCDIMNPDEAEKHARQFNKDIGIDGVMAPAVEAGISVGRVVDCLGLPGIGEKNAIDLTDKIKRRVRLDGLKIPQPKWGITDPKLWPHFPCVAKFCNRSAADGVRIAYNMQEIGIGYDYLEEYLEGWEISTEVLVFGNGSFIMAHADRNYSEKLKYAPYILENGCQLPSKLPKPLKDKIRYTIDKIIHGMGLRSCAIKLDLLIKDNIVYVIECAPRLGGGKLSSVMIPMAYGINWWSAAVGLAIGVPGIEQIQNQNIAMRKFVAQRYEFPENPKSHKDRIRSVEREGRTYEEAIKNAENAISNGN